MPAASEGLEAKFLSCTFRNCSAIRGDEATTTGNFPNFMSMISPYFWEREWRDRCGKGPRRLVMLPTIGHGFGPRGSFPGGGFLVIILEKKASAATSIRARRVSLMFSIS